MAAVLMSVAAFVLFVPYIAVRYRRRGELGLGNLALAFAGPLYGLALFFYVFAPFPPVRPDFCAAIGVRRPQLIPFQFLHDMGKSACGSGPMAMLNNPALTQVLLNVALFIPLGLSHRAGTHVAQQSRVPGIDDHHALLGLAEVVADLCPESIRSPRGDIGGQRLAGRGRDAQTIAVRQDHSPLLERPVDGRRRREVGDTGRAGSLVP
ncbi:VanZ family protein [Streptomyces sp. ID05-39B]|nr:MULTISPECIES: VanZ family protein [Streptomyces]MDX3525213.1 VanZ family protein [Streptomyces sp. ID05-39B]MDX3582108.1 VanZ family protein [Streptomyces europaeiscabiei]MDX3837455.1 VanZ family protein [Streptomyces europaeiscabiei]